MSPTISILVPTYNRSRFLKKAIESVLMQDYTDYEIIITDNCSTDDTAAVVAAYHDSRIRYVRNQVNVGATHNYNRALRLATGKYISTFSDDDIMLPGNLAAKVQVLDQHPGVGLVHSDAHNIDEQGLVIATTRHGWSPRLVDILNSEPLMLGKRAYNILYNEWNFVCMPSVMVRKSVLDDARIEFNNQLKYACDWDIWMKIARVSDFYHLQQPLIQYRVHNSSETWLLNETTLFHELTLSKIGLIQPADINGRFDEAVARILSSVHTQHLYLSATTPTQLDFLRVRIKRLVPYALKWRIKALIGRK